MNLRVFVVALLGFLLLSAASEAAGAYQRTRDGGPMVWNNHPGPDDEATWSGGKDERGYASGGGALTWWKNGEWVSRYSGQMVRGRFEGRVINEDADGTIFAGTFRAGQKGADWQRTAKENSEKEAGRAPAPERQAESGRAESGAKTWPAFLLRDYPVVDAASVQAQTVAEPKEFGFEDLPVPAGTRRVTAKLFRSEFLREHQTRIFGGTSYRSGNVGAELRIDKALRAEHSRGGPPMIVVTGYFTPSGTRIAALPMEIRYYGNITKAQVDGTLAPFRLGRELNAKIFAASPPRVDPEDMEAVFRYAGMVSERGFEGTGYFEPLTLCDRNNAWTSGRGYFGKFSSGRLVERVALETFAGPRTREAQKRRGEENAEALAILGAGAAIVMGGVAKVGGAMLEEMKRPASSGGSGGGGASTSAPADVHRFRQAHRGGTWKFTVTRDAHSRLRAGSHLTLKDEQSGKQWELSYAAGFSDQWSVGKTGGLTRNDESLVGARVEVYFHNDGEPESIKNLDTGYTCRVSDWKVTGYGW